MSGLIVLLSCGKKKQNRECPASEMYTSSLFRKSLQLARRLTDDRHIYILSAKYGLIPLNQRIRPYELCLNGFSSREREEWGNRVYQTCLSVGITDSDRIVCLAGGKYSEALRRFFPDMETPMEGMGLGHRMHWMNEQLKG